MPRKALAMTAMITFACALHFMSVAGTCPYQNDTVGNNLLQQQLASPHIRKVHAEHERESSPLSEPSWEMVDAVLPEGKRCFGKPPGGWGRLGRGISTDECKAACLKRDACQYAVYNVKKRVCTSFHTCAQSQAQGGFIVWAKHEIPASTTSPSATSASSPSPEPRMPRDPSRPYCKRATGPSSSQRGHACWTKTQRQCDKIARSDGSCIWSGHPLTDDQILLTGVSDSPDYYQIGRTGGKFHASHIRHRVDWQKFIRCDPSGRCDGCYAGPTAPNCWKVRHNGDLALSVTGASEWTRFRNIIHVTCPSAGLFLQYVIKYVWGGTLRLYWDGQEFVNNKYSFQIRGKQSPFRGKHRTQEFTGQFRENSMLKGGHEITSEFTLSAGVSSASVLISKLSLRVGSAFADCEDWKVCLSAFDTNDTESMQLRNKNTLQKECLDAADPSAVSHSCVQWRLCLDANHSTQIRTLLEAADIRGTSSGAAGIGASKCMDPRLEDPESWDCDCFGEMHRRCQAVATLPSVEPIFTESQCFRAIFCGHPRVCAQWKREVQCQEDRNITALQDVLQNAPGRSSLSQGESDVDAGAGNALIKRAFEHRGDATVEGRSSELDSTTGTKNCL